MLSPFTFWNDAFLNIPISYLCANVFIRIWPANFLLTVLVFYWLSNMLGILLMYLGGKSILREGRSLRRELVKLLLTMAAYSLILIFLGRSGILKPL